MESFGQWHGEGGGPEAALVAGAPGDTVERGHMRSSSYEISF